MQTLIVRGASVPGAARAIAYSTLHDGNTWGPLHPYVPDDSSNEVGRGPSIIALEGRTLQQTVESMFPKEATVEAPTLQGGQYYPRIWRGARVHCGRVSIVPRIDQTPFFDSFVTSLEQVESLFDELMAVFRVAHPAPDNLGAYGGAIRDLIILGCTEVESQWKRVLKANSVAASDGRYTTIHYVRVLPVMKLDEYKVKLIRYPSVPEIVPFAGWNKSNPTQSLAWYDAYNKVKHDREENYAQTTLNHAISAIAACVVMLAAQFGEKTLRSYRFENLFQFTGIPVWEPKEWYYGPLPNVAWQQINCPM